mmetsp:Transcript_43524/g.105087  ORF Transcript_43524/g.105087 Transcript_43524/m.105087 type:complete len:318 (+) Transcript_43524:177-1130(+)
MTQHSQELGSDHDPHDGDTMKDHYQSSSSYHFGSIGFCQVFECMEGWPSILSSWKGADDHMAPIPTTRQSRTSGKNVNDNDRESNERKKQHKSSSRPIDPILFRNPLAEKMVEDAVERSKYNTKSLQMMLKSVSDGERKDHYDKNDDLIDQRVALAAMKKRQKRQQIQQQQQQSSISYSRRQHRFHQQQMQHQQKKSPQDASQSFLKFYNRKKSERPQTPIPVPGPLRLDPKAASKKANQIVPKRRHHGSTTTLAISLLKRKDSNDSKRQSPPTSYCPPVSTPLVPIGEGKAMKLKKQKKLSMKWSRKVTPFQPDEY